MSATDAEYSAAEVVERYGTGSCEALREIAVVFLLGHISLHR